MRQKNPYELEIILTQCSTQGEKENKPLKDLLRKLTLEISNLNIRVRSLEKFKANRLRNNEIEPDFDHNL